MHCVFVRKLTIEVWYIVILEPIVEAMKSPSDEELDYSSDSSEYYNFSVNLVLNYVVTKKF